MATNAEIVRERLGEVIPADGNESDTAFTEAQILDLLARNGNIINRAVAEGWTIKAANYADLVDTAEGTSKRSMSDLHAHALRMADEYGGGTEETRKRTRIHRLARP